MPRFPARAHPTQQFHGRPNCLSRVQRRSAAITDRRAFAPHGFDTSRLGRSQTPHLSGRRIDVVKATVKATFTRHPHDVQGHEWGHGLPARLVRRDVGLRHPQLGGELFLGHSELLSDGLNTVHEPNNSGACFDSSTKILAPVVALTPAESNDAGMVTTPTPEHRRAKLTDEHREESARLKAIWKQRKDALAAEGLASQMAFGARFGIGTQAAVGFFLNGKTPLSLKAALGFAEGLRCSVKDFSPRLAAELARIQPHLEAGRVQMGGPDAGSDELGRYTVRAADGLKTYIAEPRASYMARGMSVGDAAMRIAESLLTLPVARRRTIAALTSEMILDGATTELADQIDLLAGDNVQVVDATHVWRAAVFSMAEHEPPDVRRQIADFLLKVDAALREKSHIQTTATEPPPSVVR